MTSGSPASDIGETVQSPLGGRLISLPHRIYQTFPRSYQTFPRSSSNLINCTVTMGVGFSTIIKGYGVSVEFEAVAAGQEGVGRRIVVVVGENDVASATFRWVTAVLVTPLSSGGIAAWSKPERLGPTGDLGRALTFPRSSSRSSSSRRTSCSTQTTNTCTRPEHFVLPIGHLQRVGCIARPAPLAPTRLGAITSTLELDV